MEKEKTVVQGSGVAAVAAVLSNQAFQSEWKNQQVTNRCIRFQHHMTTRYL
jgi:hypothetical protein